MFDPGDLVRIIRPMGIDSQDKRVRFGLYERIYDELNRAHTILRVTRIDQDVVFVYLYGFPNWGTCMGLRTYDLELVYSGFG